jgi:hypothetical protein
MFSLFLSHSLCCDFGTGGYTCGVEHEPRFKGDEGI